MKSSGGSRARDAQSNGLPPFLAAYDQLGEQKAAADQTGLVLTGSWSGRSSCSPNCVNTGRSSTWRLAVVVSRYDDVIEIAGRDDAFSVEPYGESLRRYTEDGNFLLGMDDEARCSTTTARF